MSRSSRYKEFLEMKYGQYNKTPEAVLIDLEEAFNSGYEYGYETGNEVGFNDGEISGEDRGYDKGYSACEKENRYKAKEYDDGYRVGAEEAFNNISTYQSFDKIMEGLSKYVGSSPYYKQKLIDAIEYYLKMKVVG